MSEARKPFLPLEERLPFLAGEGWRSSIRVGMENLMGLPPVRRGLDELAERVARGAETFQACLDIFEIGLQADGVVEAIPPDGPLVLIANHPFGGADPLALMTLALRARPDVRILGNVEVQALPGIEKWLLPLEILDGEGAARKNLIVLREALQHLRQGGALAVFPSGAVSHWQWDSGRVEDPPWSPHTARIVKTSRAGVLPVRFFGQNGPLFQALGMLHPLMRSALIPRAFLAMSGGTVHCRAGGLLNHHELPQDPIAISDRLRKAVYEVQGASRNLFAVPRL